MIKNFVYLDEEKMYSLSSQVFEGITEYILSESTSESQKSESQKGDIGSGRILGDILKQADRQSEKKFLHDYSYTLFEKKLIDDKKVLELSNENKDVADLCKDKSFIKVVGKAVFNDMKSIQNTLKQFNQIGKALTHVTNFEEISKVKDQLEKSKATIKDRNQKSKLKSQTKALTNINKLAKDSGLYHDQKFLDDLSFLLGYGFQDQLEVQIKIEDTIVSANLKRSCLREEENLMIRKYSRQTEVEFVLFGVITQYQREEAEKELVEKDDFESIKEALINLVAHMTTVETAFTGRLKNEIIIDPIALYTEI